MQAQFLLNHPCFVQYGFLNSILQSALARTRVGVTYIVRMMLWLYSGPQLDRNGVQNIFSGCVTAIVKEHVVSKQNSQHQSSAAVFQSNHL